jgi:CBS-domain-containing membrane protein
LEKYHFLPISWEVTISETAAAALGSRFGILNAFLITHYLLI